MNNTISLVSSPKIFTYNLEGQRVKVNLLNNPFDFEPQTLFSLAARKNKKRGFLFVSNVLGKHVPVDPFVPLLAGISLAVQFLSKIYGVKHVDLPEITQAMKGHEQAKNVYETVVEKPLIPLPKETLFIGFAETATGLGHTVFSIFDNAHYLHTTREQIPLLHSELNFNEDHSHAVNHRCYPIDTEVLKTAETIVLVDDEITTGNTALNIIRAIHSKYPKAEYVVLSLLDWRTTKDRVNFRELEQQLSTKIHTIALMEGEITITGDSVPEKTDNVKSILRTECLAEIKTFPEQKFLSIPEVVPVFSEDSSGKKNRSPYLQLTGRFGLSSNDNLKTLSLARKIGEELRKDRTGKKTLCLGTGEFMYFPMLVSGYMGEGIRYHSTTRSPIYPFSKPHYAIQNGFAFESPDESSTINYVYNVPLNYYEEVYLFLERDVGHERLMPLLTTFRDLGIPRLVLVICGSSESVCDSNGVSLLLKKGGQVG